VRLYLQILYSFIITNDVANIYLEMPFARLPHCGLRSRFSYVGHTAFIGARRPRSLHTSFTGHAAVIGAWQLLERDDLDHWRHLQVTLRLLGRNDPGHCIRHLQVTLRLLERGDLGLFSWNVIGWREWPKPYKLRRAAAVERYDLWALRGSKELRTSKLAPPPLGVVRPGSW